MKVSVNDLSPTQKKLQVVIPAEEVQPELDKRYQELAKKARLKGFRPGKIPRNIIKNFYGKSIESEVSSQFIHNSYPQALEQAALKPLAEADIEELNFDDDGTFTYSALVEVGASFALEGYKGMEVSVEPIAVSDAEIDAELQKARENHAELQSLEEDQAAEVGLMTIIDVKPMVGGVVFEKGKADGYLLELGKNTIHPEFDQYLVGHKVGEVVEFDLDYPEQQSAPEIAGKHVHFVVAIKELKRKVLPELNDDFANAAGDFENLDQMRAKIRSDLLEARERKVNADKHQQMIDQLIDRTPFEVSAKVIEHEVNRLVGQLQQQFKAQGVNVDTTAFNSPEVRAGYALQAQRNVRWQLISEGIAEREQITLSAEDQEEIYEQAARMFRVSKEKVKSDYARSQLVEQLKAGKLQEKIFAVLDEHAVVTEKQAQPSATSKE